MIIPDKKKAVGVILGKMDAGGQDSFESEEHEEQEGADMLHGIAEDLLEAIKMGSAHAVASSLKAAFQALESLPHEEAGE